MEGFYCRLNSRSQSKLTDIAFLAAVGVRDYYVELFYPLIRSNFLNRSERVSTSTEFTQHSQ